MGAKGVQVYSKVRMLSGWQHTHNTNTTDRCSMLAAILAYYGGNRSMGGNHKDKEGSPTRNQKNRINRDSERKVLGCLQIGAKWLIQMKYTQVYKLDIRQRDLYPKIRPETCLVFSKTVKFWSKITTNNAHQKIQEINFGKISTLLNQYMCIGGMFNQLSVVRLAAQRHFNNCQKSITS